MLPVVVQPPPPELGMSPRLVQLLFLQNLLGKVMVKFGLVVDPDKVTGDDYTVGFAVSEDTTWDEPIWYLQNSAGEKF